MGIAAVAAGAAVVSAGVSIGTALSSSGAGGANASYSNLLQAQTAAIQRQQQIADAYLKGTADPGFASTVGQLETNSRANYISALNDAIATNKRGLAAGGPGLFTDQSRRDEDTYRALQTGFENARQTALNSTYSIYAGAAGMQNTIGQADANAAAGYGKFATSLTDQFKQQVAQANAATTGFGNLVDSVGNLYDNIGSGNNGGGGGNGTSPVTASTNDVDS